LWVYWFSVSESSGAGSPGLSPIKVHLTTTVLLLLGEPPMTTYSLDYWSSLSADLTSKTGQMSNALNVPSTDQKDTSSVYNENSQFACPAHANCFGTSSMSLVQRQRRCDGRTYRAETVRLCRVSIFRTLKLRDCWTDIDETWQVYSMGLGTRLL